MQPGDVLRTAADLPDVQVGDVLIFGLAGAYSSVRCSTFNGRPLPAEVCLGPDGIELFRRRRSAADLVDDLDRP